MVKVTNAFAAREALKDMGAKWDGVAKAWMLTDEAYAVLTERLKGYYYRAATDRALSACRYEVVA
jgi:hypothetical protein